MQYQKAMSGNWQALQWLGKIELGQKEPISEITTAPNQQEIDKDHIIMRLQNRIAELEENANKSEAR
jgi:hypothetical protein